MKAWKVILATLVIFGAGFVAGAVLIKATSRKVPPPRTSESVPAPMIVQQRFLERMDRELTLDPEQRLRLEKVFSESRERMKILWDLIGPEMDAELREVRDKIRAELRSEQRNRFEELLKQRHRPGSGPDGQERGRGRRGTNSSDRTQERSAGALTNLNQH